MRSSSPQTLLGASLVALAALGAFAGTAYGADTRPPKPEMSVRMPEYSLQTQVYDFPTGLRIMFQADHSYPVVSTYMIVNHGSSSDPEGKDEAAHFVEHTWFRSLHGDLPPIMDVVQDLSGVFNASTWNDWTNYSTVANSEYLPRMMQLESLRLTEPYKGMTEEQTQTEREVIRNEWRRRNENNNALMFDYLYNVLYPAGHPYHSTSTHDTIDNLTLVDLQKYFDDYYTPKNTTITFVGDVPSDPNEQLSLIFENFDPKLLHSKLTAADLFLFPKPGLDHAPDQANPADWSTGAWDPGRKPGDRSQDALFKFAKAGPPRISDQREEPPALGSKEIGQELAPVDKPIAIVGWSLPGGYRDDHIDMVVLGNLAGNVMLNGLLSQYQEKQLNMNNSGCFAQAEVLNTTLMCLVEIKDSKVRPEDMVEKMLDQFSVLWNPDMKLAIDQQFTRAKNEFLVDELLGLDTVASIFGGRADSIGTYAHLTSDPAYYSVMLDQYGQIQGTELANIAYTYMKRERAARLVVSPLPEDQIDTTSSESGYIGASKGDDVVKGSDDLSKLTAKDIAAARIRPDTKKIDDSKLANGLRVIIMPHGEAPVVRTSLVFGGGSATGAKGELDFVQEFTQGSANDPLQIAGRASWPFQSGIAGLFAAVSYPLIGATGPNVWPNALRMDFDAPSGDLDAMLWIMRDEVEGAHPYTSGAPQWKNDLFDAVKGNWANKDWHVQDSVNQHLYPGSPWHQDWTWEEAVAAQEFGNSTIQTYLNQHLDPENAVLMIVGNVDPAEAKKLAEQHFGGWQGKGSTTSWLGALKAPAMATAPTRVLLFDDPKKTQSQTDMFCRLNYKDESDRAAVGVLGSVLGAEVFDTLRVKEALSYTPYAYGQVNDDNSAVLGFGSLALNSGVARTIEYFMQVAEEVESGKVKEDMVKLHKLREARSSGITSQSVTQMAGTLAAPVRRGEDWKFIDNAGVDIANVSTDQLVRLVQGCTDHAIVTIVGPKDVLGPQLQAKGIAYEVVDWKARGDELLGKYDPKALKKKQKAKAKADAKKAKKGEETEASGTETPAPTPAPTPFDGLLGQSMAE